MKNILKILLISTTVICCTNDDLEKDLEEAKLKVEAKSKISKIDKDSIFKNENLFHEMKIHPR